MGRIDEWYNAAEEEYPPQIGYCDMGDIDYNCGYREAFVKGVERGERTMIERACKWLEENMSVVNANAVNYGDISFAASKIIGGKENFVKEFKKAMEG